MSTKPDQVQSGADMYVQFLYDAENRVVGLQPVAPETKDSYPVRKQPQSQSYLVTGRGFLAYYGIETDRVRRYAARIYDDTVVGFSLLEDEQDKEDEEGGDKDEAAS